MKKFLIIFGIILGLLLAAAVSIPFLFKDRIIAEVKKAANEQLTAVVDFKNVDISLFRHFPKLSVGLDELTVTGTGPFDGIPLVHCPRLDVAVDLWSAIFGTKMSIKGLYLEKPDLRVYVLKDGQANYDIAKPAPKAAPASSSAASSPIRLEHYEITDGAVLYDDRALDMRAELQGLNHEGSGEFTSDLYDFVMQTAIQKLSVNYGGVQYLRDAHADWKATLSADMPKMKFTFKENDLKVNALTVNLDGWVQLPNEEDIAMDLTFGTPQNTFKSLLSIVPGAFTQDFDAVKADGTVQFSGFARGLYNEKTYPAFKIDLKIGNGTVKYPTLPLGLSNINVDMAVNSPAKHLDAMTVDVPKFSLRVGSNPLEGYFYLKTPESNPAVDTKIVGTLNLGELSRAFPLSGVEELSGSMQANVLAKASMRQIEQQQYEQVQMAGTFGLQNVTYRAAGTPPVRIDALQTSLSPQRVEVQQFSGRLGKSDLRASGSIDNILAWFSTSKTMTGKMTFASSYVDANEWMAPAPGTAPAPAPPSDDPAVLEKAFDRWDFTADGRIGKLVYDTYTINDLNAAGHFTPNKMDLSSFGLRMGESDLRGSGHLLNVWNYLFDKQEMSGNVALASDYFDLNPFMTPAAPAAAKTPAAAPVAASVMPIPEKINMTVKANFAKLKYTNLLLENLDGAVAVNDRRAELRDCTARMLGGQVGLTGAYDTRDLAKPLFNVDMAIQNMGFRSAYQNLVTMQTLAPIAQLMDGTFNTTLSMSGVLGKDMTPDFSTLNAAGFLETINAFLNDFKGLNEIGSRLNIDYLKRLELKSTRNWFEVKNGAVEVKPFNLDVRDVAMQVSGSHSLKNEMNYQVLTKTPRASLEKNAVGATANRGLQWISGEASKYGVNVAQGEYINVLFTLAGSLLNPKVSAKVLASDGQRTIKEEASAAVQQTIDKARDSVTNVANRELDKAKEKAKAAADKAVDTLGKIADQKIQQATDKVVDQVKDQAGKVISQEVGEKVGDVVGEKVGEKAGEVLGDKGKKTVEDVKNKLDKWDPFKKKKN